MVGGFFPTKICKKCSQKGLFCGLQEGGEFYIECANQECRHKEVKCDPKGPLKSDELSEEVG